MKLRLITPLLFLLSSLVFFSCNNSGKSSEGEKIVKEEVADSAKVTLAFDPESLPEEPIFDIKTTEGTIRVKLYKETPLHRDNFIKLASERFYDNVLFHRVINNFMIQGGDPITKDPNATAQYGTGGPGYTVPAEFVEKYNHKKGALAAARRGGTANPQKASSGSQFYIVHSAESCASLNGDYTVYGETLQGLDVVDKIATTPTNQRDQPLTPVKIISVLPVTE